MDAIQPLIAAAQENPRRVVLPEGSDGRILEAARRLKDDGIAEPVLLGHIRHAAGGVVRMLTLAEGPGLQRESPGSRPRADRKGPLSSRLLSIADAEPRAGRGPIAGLLMG